MSAAGPSTSDEFGSELATMGFTFAGRDRRGRVVQYVRRPNRFLTEWIHDDGVEALFTWEFELGEYFSAHGWQIGAAETSFQILYPQTDVRIARDADSVASEVARLEMLLSRLDLADPSL